MWGLGAIPGPLSCVWPRAISAQDFLVRERDVRKARENRCGGLNEELKPKTLTGSKEEGRGRSCQHLHVVLPSLTQWCCPQHLLLSHFLPAYPVAPVPARSCCHSSGRHRLGRPHVNFLWGTDVAESKPGHPWSRRDLGFQCPGEAGSAGDMDIMRKESIVPPWLDQILILPFGSYHFSPSRRPLGWRFPLAAPWGVFWGGREVEGPDLSPGRVRTMISHLLHWPWLGGMAAVGKGAFGHPVLPKASSTIPLANIDERAYTGRDLLSCNPRQCPRCATTWLHI